MEEQKARRAELESYMVGLRESKTEDGDPAVLLPTVSGLRTLVSCLFEGIQTMQQGEGAGWGKWMGLQHGTGDRGGGC